MASDGRAARRRAEREAQRVEPRDVPTIEGGAMSDHVTPNLAELQEQRRRLAVDALDGKRGALRELEKVGAAILESTIAVERRRLAEEERQLRVQREDRERREAERAKLEAERPTIIERQRATAQRADRLVEELAGTLDSLYEDRKLLWSVDAALGTTGNESALRRFRSRMGWVVRHHLASRVSGIPGLDRRIEVGTFQDLLR